MVNKLVGGAVLVIALVGCVFAYSLFNQKSEIERRAAGYINMIIESINEFGPASVRGSVGSEPWLVKDHWTKFIGIFDQHFVIESIRLSNFTRHPVSRNPPMAIYIVHGNVSGKDVALQIATSAQDLVYWNVRSFDNELVEQNALKSACQAPDSISGSQKADRINLAPPWIMFPRVPRFSRDWLDQDKHSFILAFGKSWSQLDEQAQESFMNLNRPPMDWIGWYDDLRSSWAVDSMCADHSPVDTRQIKMELVVGTTMWVLVGLQIATLVPWRIFKSQILW